MGLIEINKHPSARELKWFGILLSIFVGLVGALVRWRHAAPTVAAWIWTGGGIGVGLYALVPAIRRPIYLIWVHAGYPVGWLVSHAILTAVYYLVLTPIGIIMRGTRNDPMARKFERRTRSYWVPRRRTTRVTRYFRQS